MLQINPGELWLTRGGAKARIYAVDGGHGYAIHGAMNIEGGGWEVRIWTIEGKYVEGEQSTFDLVRRHDWREELKQIWDLLKPQYKFVSIDLIGNGWVHETRPQKEGSRYYNYGTLWCGQLVFPKPDCPWYETLTERP